jgi:hypothetical protein
MANGIDPAMKGDQPPHRDSVLDRAARKAQVPELPAADDAMLAVGNAGDRPIVGWDGDVCHVRPRISWSKWHTSAQPRG